MKEAMDNQASQSPVALKTEIENEAEGLYLKDYVYLILDNLWLIVLFGIVGFLFGYIRAELITPIYEGEATVQVDLISTPEKQVTDNILGSQKFAFNSEFEVLRSRKLSEKVIVKSNSYIIATPIQVPIIGNWLARNNPGISDPIELPFLSGKYVYGNESLKIENLELPQSLQNSGFKLTVMKEGKFIIENSNFKFPLEGELNQPIIHTGYDGSFIIKISQINAKPGTSFSIYRASVTDQADELRAGLMLSEKASFSGILRIAYRHPNPKYVVEVVNTVAQEYVEQNIEKRTGDIEKSLQFLDKQIPYYTKLVEDAEDKLVEFRVRNKGGLLDSEIGALVGKTTEIESKKREIEQRQIELSRKYTTEHPSMRAIQNQLEIVVAEAESVKNRISQLPPLQQDALRLFREININLETLGRLRSSALQLNLLREGKINNIRVLDPATLPREPISPNKINIITTSTVGFLGVAFFLILLRRYLAQSILDSGAIERTTGIAQFAAVPLAKEQVELEKTTNFGKINLLSITAPNNTSVEIIRSMCSAILFTVGSKSGSVILITGPTPGVGKSFISANTAALLASLNKRILLVDADLRKGHMNREFGVSKTPGLSDLIGPDAMPDYESAIHRQIVPNLDLITTGHFPSDPARLFLSVDFPRFIDKVRKEYDLIIIDSAPVMAAADSSVIAAYADAVLLVARAELTRTSEILESKRKIAHAGALIAGYIFNGFDSTKLSYGYAYGYGYGYGRGYGYGYKYAEPSKDEKSRKFFGISLKNLFAKKMTSEVQKNEVPKKNRDDLEGSFSVLMRKKKKDSDSSDLG
jgi:tyrosine-protein kinase Etk/Wzc